MPLSKSKGGPLERSVLEALARSEASGSWKKRAYLTDAPVHKELQRGTQKNYRHALDMWDGFLTSLDDDWVKDPNDLRTAKAFVSFIASGIAGRERGSKPAQSSVVQCWKNLTADYAPYPSAAYSPVYPNGSYHGYDDNSSLDPSWGQTWWASSTSMVWS
ncbi:hypothetical protein AX16_008555 [Volvariella volvacea WC 439]|nr:hypothetical protein AX16_008555 [Volvariella volvacea WC 439]